MPELYQRKLERMLKEICEDIIRMSKGDEYPTSEDVLNLISEETGEWLGLQLKPSSTEQGSDFHVSNRLTEEGKQKVAFVDIDETICFYSGERRYDLSEPNQENIDKINKMYDEGWKIIYWTARGSVSGRNYKEHTKKQLTEWGCRYHELKTGDEKPHFDLVIDDKAKRIEEI